MKQHGLKAVDLACWTGGDWAGTPPEHIEGVSHDTRTLRYGNIFVALVGERFDGHVFVSEAFKKGACGAVVNRSMAVNITERPLLCTDDTRRALIDAARRYRNQLQSTIIGITGSVGKTTVKEMLGGVLELVAPTVRAQKSWNNAIGVPLTVLNIIPECKFAVFELGTNHPGEIKQLCEIVRPECGMITSIGPAHIGNFGSLEAIAKEKGTLLEYLPKNGIAIINVDDAFYEYFRSICRARLVTVSVEGQADFQLVKWHADDRVMTVQESSTGEIIDLRLSVSGRHNAINALLVVAMSRAMGATWEQIDCAISGYKGISAHLEKRNIADICLIDDTCNANPLSMRAAIEYLLSERVEGRKGLVLGGMLELGHCEKVEHRNLGRWIASKFIEQSDKMQGNNLGGLITVGELGQLIAESVLAGGMLPELVFMCRDIQHAVGLLIERARRGDCVLFKASRRICLEKAIEYFIKAKERE